MCFPCKDWFCTIFQCLLKPDIIICTETHLREGLPIPTELDHVDAYDVEKRDRMPSAGGGGVLIAQLRRNSSWPANMSWSCLKPKSHVFTLQQGKEGIGRFRFLAGKSTFSWAPKLFNKSFIFSSKSVSFYKILHLYCVLYCVLYVWNIVTCH